MVLEFCYVICVVIDEVFKCKVTGEVKIILFSLIGYGYFDMVFYDKYFFG